jgi:chemotaxis family two-component system response regulator Rcp1
LIPAEPVRLIIAEDNDVDVYLIRTALDTAGLHFEAEIASNGEKALAMIDRFAPASGMNPDRVPDGIILDLNLMTHGGLDILQRLRAIPALAKTPVVILTSSDSPPDRKKAQILGAAAFLLKPIDLDQYMKIGQQIARLFTNRPEATSTWPGSI